MSKVAVVQLYIVQPFDGAIAAVPEGEWDAVEAIAWN